MGGYISNLTGETTILLQAGPKQTLLSLAELPGFPVLRTDSCNPKMLQPDQEGNGYLIKTSNRSYSTLATLASIKLST